LGLVRRKRAVAASTSAAGCYVIGQPDLHDRLLVARCAVSHYVVFPEVQLIFHRAE
jgi:hypothetical protein